MHCTLEIDLLKIRANYRVLSALCQNSAVGAVVKANGYSLGAEQVSEALTQESCQIFFVASIEEGVSLRKALDNDKIRIFVLHGLIAKYAPEFNTYRLTPVLSNMEQVACWQKFASSCNQRLPCILHLNTGLHRLGVPEPEIMTLINDPHLLLGLDIQYIMSHLSNSGKADDPYNVEQLTTFNNFLQYFPRAKGSMANSGGVLLGEEYHFDLVRPGAALYGLHTFDSSIANLFHNPIKLTAPIIHLQQLTADRAIGYNGSFMTKRSSVIATLPLGYADGYARSFSNRGVVYIGNHTAQVVGRVSMDLINIDVTDLPREKIFLGQRVEIIGDNCTPDKMAEIIGTIGHEILTNLGNRYKRIYKNNV